MLDSIIFCSTLAAGWFIVLSTPQPYCLCLSPTSTFVNWALPANKLRIMCCFFITNMLEEHRPIKGGIFCVEWWARHRCREMGVGWEECRNELTKLKLRLLLVWAAAFQHSHLSDYDEPTSSLLQSSQSYGGRIWILTEYYQPVLCINTNSYSAEGG